MNHRFFLTFALLFIAAAPAVAQTRVRDCSVDRELIFEMTKAEYGAYNVWDAVFGEMNTDERFVSSVVADSGNVVAAGETASYGKADKALHLVEFDNRGRVVWDVSHAIAGLTGIKKMLLTAEGFTIAGTSVAKGRTAVWLGFFDTAGKLLSQKTISGNQSLLPEDFIVQNNGKGFLLSASSGDAKKKLFHAVLYHIDAKGRVTDDHAYMPGLDNRIISLSPGGKDYYYASGYLRGEDGRMTGWILKLNKDGSLVWQMQYPRGASAQVNKAVPMVKDSVLATGETTPLNNGNKAGWVMMIDGNTGALNWQRYYTGAMDQSGLDILVNMEGMASVMMQASKPANEEPVEGNQDFVRLLTVNERGVLFKSDEYFNAEGAQGWQMIGGRAGERILTGRTDIVYKIEPKPGDPVETLKHGWDSWVIVAAPMESFADECLAADIFAP